MKSIVKNNRRRVQSLTGLEIWLLIVGRFVVGVGVGIVLMNYSPIAASRFGWPLVAVGMLVMLPGARGLFRKSASQPPA